jgi:hypothetical protein
MTVPRRIHIDGMKEFSKSALMRRGWTAATIRQLLGPPDRQWAGQPADRTHIFRYWNEERVFEAEKQEHVKEAIALRRLFRK